MFWSLTLRELFREFAAARLRAKDESQRDIALAWNVVAIYVDSIKRDGNLKLKGLTHYLADGRAERPQTVSEMKGALMTLSAVYKMPLRVQQKAKA